MGSPVQYCFRMSGITIDWTKLGVALIAVFICAGLTIRYSYETKNIVSTVPLSVHYFRISGIPAGWTEVGVVGALKSLKPTTMYDEQHPRLVLYPACSGSTQTGLLKLVKFLGLLEATKLDKLKVELSVEGESEFVDIDGHFYDLTPLNNPGDEHIVE
jgi:hypothetical protein